MKEAWTVHRRNILFEAFLKQAKNCLNEVVIRPLVKKQMADQHLANTHMTRAMSSVNQMKGEGICTVDKTQARLESCGLHSKGRLLALPGNVGVGTRDLIHNT
jgi:hypothetical protein